MHLSRRALLKSSLALAVSGMAPALARAALPEAARELSFHNIHTGESLKTVYWEKGAYVPQGLTDIAYLLRDYRTGDVHAIDPRLLDLLATLHARLDSKKPFEVISGFRSLKTNTWLFETTGGVSLNSLHMQGKAIDVRLTDRPVKVLRDAACALRQGGVGFYPKSNFVHVDTGEVQTW